MKEMEINEFLALKLEEGKTHIYINGKKFLQCKRLVISVPKQNIPMYDNIDSIDEAADLHQKYLQNSERNGLKLKLSVNIRMKEI